MINTAGDNVGVSTPFPPGTERRGLVVDRPYFQRFMATGEPVVSEVIVSRTTLRPTVILGVPVHDEKGAVIGAVLVSLNLQVLADSLQGIAQSPDENILLVDTAERSCFTPASQRSPRDNGDLATSRRSGTLCRAKSLP